MQTEIPLPTLSISNMPTCSKKISETLSVPMIYLNSSAHFYTLKLRIVLYVQSTYY
jgi:hypothetical protein